MFMKQKNFKRCPRCDTKTPIFQDKCDYCGLVFSRLTKATNFAAKKAIKKKEYNKVIMDKVLPVDVNKWNLFVYALFFGWFGFHYAKVGRYKMFTYMIISSAMIYIAALLPMTWFNHEYLFLLMWGLVLPGSVSAIWWIVSLFQILFNKFKVPISIDEELVKEDLDFELVDDILKEVKSNKKDKLYKKELAKQGEKNSLNNEVSFDDNKSSETEKNGKQKIKKIKVVCASCGITVKVYENETICPKCDEPLKEE